MSLKHWKMVQCLVPSSSLKILDTQGNFRAIWSPFENRWHMNLTFFYSLFFLREVSPTLLHMQIKLASKSSQKDHLRQIWESSSTFFSPFCQKRASKIAKPTVKGWKWNNTRWNVKLNKTLQSCEVKVLILGFKQYTHYRGLHSILRVGRNYFQIKIKFICKIKAVFSANKKWPKNLQ